MAALLGAAGDPHAIHCAGGDRLWRDGPGGFHAVIAPGVLADQLHRTSHFLAGGIGVIATFANMIVASLTFAVMIIVFALVALYFGMRH
jgi:hypothetical protein